MMNKHLVDSSTLKRGGDNEKTKDIYFVIICNNDYM